MSHGEILFNIGIVSIIASVLLGIVALVVFKVLFSKLNLQLDKEYGQQENAGKKPARFGSDR